MKIEIRKADVDTFRKYKTEVMEIYVEACKNALNQYVNPEEEEARFMRVVEEGYGLFAFHKNVLVGFLLVTSLSSDTLLPERIATECPVNQSLYVDEMHIREGYRRQGIGTRLLHRLLNDVDRERYGYLFIRTGKNNIPAMNLYKSFGFEPAETIKEEKVTPDQSDTFTMEKQYLILDLSK